MKKLLMVVFIAAGLTSCNEQKTAYVDTTRLIQEYSEMKEVESEFTTKSDQVKGRLDSIARVFQTEVQEYQKNMNSLSTEERQATEQELMRKQQAIQQQQQMMGTQLRQESDMVIDSIINKVKDYVKEYGEENDYTYIFGSNESANIMYAKEGLDITEEILAKLNTSYTGGTEVEDAETEVEVETEE